MKTKNLMLPIAAAAIIAAGGYGLYQLGLHQGMKQTGANSTSTTSDGGGDQQGGKIDPATGKRVLYWHDPMVPGQKFDKPGKSPFMDMQLVPVYADEAGDEGKITISPRVQQNLGVRTAEVTKGALGLAVEAVGSVAYNERDVAVVPARSNGFVEKLFVRAPLDPVRKGQPLVELYVPEWVAAQEEYLSARSVAGTRMGGLIDGARQRMRLAGMTDDLIQLVESTGKVHSRSTVRAPITGVIAELGAREGMTVMAGQMLFRINGLATVWVNAEVPENLAGEVRPGSPVEAKTPARPGTVFKGRVGAILPEVNPTTRTIKARVELANRDNQLVPGMFATINFTSAARKEAVLVPTEAVIQTGSRNVVVVAQGDGKFAPIDVDLGSEAGGKTEIRKGLEPGQKVVVSGQFLVDSEASLKGTLTRMSEAGKPEAEMAKGATHHGEGKIERIDKSEITISHGPIASLQWGAMTMGFQLPANRLPKNVAVGDNVMFEFRQTNEGKFEIESISPMNADQPKHSDMTNEKPRAKK